MAENFSVSVHEYTLPNGLRVLTVPFPLAPVVSVWAFYRVGSRHEHPGITGISHWVEHMLFKGTPKFPKGQIARLIQKQGGTLNGHTSYDHTAYFETLPKENWLIALDIEADRMTEALFDPEETELERGVILSELEMYENHPEHRLFREVMACAYQVHPYRNPIIGWRPDLERMTRDDLYTHYRNFYAPDNAFLVLSGALDEEEALREVEKRFGDLPPRGLPRISPALEPPQQSERRIRVKGYGQVPSLMMVFHAPTYRSNGDETQRLLPYALHLLAAILGQGRTSRLYRELVETRKALTVWASNHVHKEGAFFSVFVSLTGEASLPEVEGIVWTHLRRLTEEPPSPEELDVVLHREEANFLRALDGATERAFQVGAYEILGDWRWLNDYLPRLRSVTPDLLKTAASQTFTETNGTVGWFEPKA